jgi:autotransporter adhesin
VALGANAVADGSTLGTAAYNPGTAGIAGTAPVGEVSIGAASAERRITNVAAGATDTDAVNVSQLKSVASDVSDLGDRAVRYDGNPGDPKTSISLEGPASTDGGRTGGTRISNVARGDVSENSTDAINGSQLHETNQQVAQNTGDIAQIGDTITNIAGDTSQASTDANGMGIRYARTNEAGLAQSDAFAQGEGSTAVGYNATASADSALALGREAEASHAGSVALGANAVADGTTLGTAAYNPGTASIAGTAPVGEVSIGSAGAERRITNVAAGATDTDAVNVSQLKSVATDVSDLGDRAVRYDGNPGDPKTSISLEGPASTDGGRTGGTTITNVARGDVSENSTDAVNGSQLHETNQNVTQLGDTVANIAGDTSQANTDANGMGIRYARTNEAGLAQSDAFAQGQGSTAVGYNATATADSALALGREAQASHAGSVALGANAVADGATLGTAAYNPGTAAIAGTAPVGEVSVGSTGAERRITHVAAGATDTDAVNVSQLKSVASDVSNLGDRAVRYDGNPGDPKTSISLEGPASTDGGRTGGTTITNVARGDVSENSTDAINGSQLHETNQQVAQNTGDINQIGDTITNIAGDTSQANTDANGLGIRYARTNEAGLAQSDAFAQGQGSTAVGYNATATADSALALGREAQASHAGSVALGANAVADGSTLGTAAYNPGTVAIAGTAPVGEVSIGSAGAERRITNVAAGATDTDAVNVSQLKSVASDVSNLGDRAVRYDGNPGDPKTSISLEGPASTDGGRTGGTTITNVARGDVSENSTDVVNGSQLHETNQQVAQNTGDINQIGDTITNIAGDTSQASTDANGLGIRYARTNEAGLAQSDAFAQGQGSTAVGYNATASADSALALGRETHANVEGSVALGAGAVSNRTLAPDSGSIAAGSGGALVPFNTTDRTLLGAVSVGSDTTYRQITNVADGTGDHDAVTVRQLTGAITSVTVTGTRYFHANSTQEDSLAAGTDSIAIGPNTVVNGNDGIGMGNGAVVEQNAPGGIAFGEQARSRLADGIAIGTQALADAEQGVALGTASRVSVGGGVALGAGSIADTAAGAAGYVPTGADGTGIDATRSKLAAVSVGDVAAGEYRQITGVAAGTVDTDAVNVSQLKALASNVDDLDAGAVKYDRNPDGSIDYESVTLNPDGDPTRLRNVAAGDVSADSTDAINGSQLHETNQNVTQLGDTVANIAGDTSQANTDANGMGIRYARTNEAGLAQSDAFAQGQGSTAVGYNATASADSALALGREAQASHAGSVALGANAVADGATLGTAAYNPGTASIAGTAPVGEVSVGSAGSERRITHVAAGATDTDAVNVSQLKAVATDVSSISDRAVRYDGNPGDPKTSISLEGPASTDGGRTGGTRISNVARGDVSENSTDAVNGSQLHETNQQVAQNTGDINQIGDTITNIAGDTGQANTDANGIGIRYARTNEAGLAQSDAFAQGQGSTAVGYNATATADSALALGREAQASHAGSVALGANAVADGTTLGTAAYNPGTAAIAGTAPVGEVSVGSAGAERRITHVAAGATDTDAVNVSQLKAVATDVSSISDRAVRYDGNPGDPKTSISLEGPASTDGGRTGGTRISNVARGDVSENSTDAINGSQLHETNQQVAQNTGDIAQIGDTITNIAGDTSQASTDANGLGIRYARTNEAGLAQSDAFAQGQGSTAVGYNATATADSALALGREAQASHAGSVALGANAVADGSTLGTAAYNPGTAAIAGTAPVGEVSIGSAGAERRITNVAAGATDTDAVNVSQLKAVDSKFQDLIDTDTGIKYFHANSQAADSRALGAESIAIGPRALAEAEQAIALGDAATAAGAGAIALGSESEVRGARAASLGSGNNVSGAGAFALGNNNTVAAANAFVLGSNVSILDGNLNGAVVLGNGSTVTAARATAGGTINGTEYVYAGGNPAAGDVLSVGSALAPRQIQNVAAGRIAADSTDAVNGSQLHATNQAIDSLGMTVNSIANGGAGVKYFHANGGASAALPDSQANGLGSVAAGPAAVASGANSVAMGNGAVAHKDGDVALGAGSVADRGAESYTGKYSGAQNDTVGTVSVGAPGAERTVSNVADGRNATDAVNVRQLEGAVKEANEYTDKRITEVAGSVVEVGDKIDKIDNRVTAVEGDVSNIKNGADGMFQVSQGDTPPPAPKASGSNSTAGGAGAVASGKDSTAIGNGAQATGAGATAVGQGSKASGSNSVALGTGSEASRDNSVSVGSEGSERQIINVARGTSGTDAVNVNQLREVESGLSNQVAGVRRDLQRLDSRLSAGIAGAMAMSGLPQAYLPGKSMFSMGGATWRGESGFAMGLSSVSENGKWVVKGLANSTSRGDVGAAVGVGYQW